MLSATCMCKKNDKQLIQFKQVSLSIHPKRNLSLDKSCLLCWAPFHQKKHTSKFPGLTAASCFNDQGPRCKVTSKDFTDSPFWKCKRPQNRHQWWQWKALLSHSTPWNWLVLDLLRSSLWRMHSAKGIIYGSMPHAKGKTWRKKDIQLQTRQRTAPSTVIYIKKPSSSRALFFVKKSLEISRGSTQRVISETVSGGFWGCLVKCWIRWS